MNSHLTFFIFLSVLASLNVGTVRKTENPIRDTQTDPILYEQKKEEEKDGKKGPLLYHVKNYPRETFFIDRPFEKEKEKPPKEIVTEETPSATDTAGWWEEQPTDSQEVSSAKMASEPLPESLSEEEKIRESETMEQPPAVQETEAAKAGKEKEGDYWW